MASNKTQSAKKVAPKAKPPAKAKASPKAKAAPTKAGPRHPKARVAEAHGFALTGNFAFKTTFFAN